MRILFVCTGNICRSPTAELLTRAYADGVGDRHAGLQPSSAGIRAVVGSGMEPTAALVLSGLGGSAEGFQARQLRTDLVEAADLILTMTTSQRAFVLRMAPRAMARTFTLLEASRLLAWVSPGLLAGTPTDSVAQLASLRALRAEGARPGTDDVPDPIGKKAATFAAAGQQISDALIPLLAFLVADLSAESPAAHTH